MQINLKKEQQNTLQRPRLNYGFAPRLFFFLMDFLAGKKNTLPKLKLLEILASIPYREWELRQYFHMSMQYANHKKVDRAQKIVEWGREAQDNEYMHLMVINEKMKEDGGRNQWYLSPVIVFLMVTGYILFSKIITWVNIKSGFRFNAQFEDHAEHIYAQMVEEHPEWEQQPLYNTFVQSYADVENWADVFRRIGLDERDHRNHSFYHAGKPEKMARYEGMPQLEIFSNTTNN